MSAQPAPAPELTAEYVIAHTLSEMRRLGLVPHPHPNTHASARRRKPR